MTAVRIIACLSLVWVGLSAPSLPMQAAESDLSNGPQKLRVVTQLVEPFVMEKDGKLSGYSIDLWNEVASRANLSFDYKIVSSIPEMLEAVRDGEADVAVGALTINPEREKTVDFSYPFYQSGLKIAVSGGSIGAYLKVLASYFWKEFPSIFGWVCGIYLVAALLFRLLKQSDDLELPPQPRATPIERLATTVWVLAVLLLASALLATINSTLTANSLSREIRGMSDLPDRQVGTLEGTTSAGELAEAGVEARYYPDLRSALKDLQEGKLEAVIYDAAVLRYWVKETKGVELLPLTFKRQAYGFGMKDGSGNLRKRINEVLLAIVQEGGMKRLNQKWLGENED